MAKTQFFYKFRDHSMIAAFLHLEDTTAENGGLAVFPGSHRLFNECKSYKTT